MSPGMLTPTPAAAPSANLGAQAHAAGQVKQALHMLELALPNVALDSPLHKVITSFITGAAKHLPEAGGADKGIQESMLRDLALKAQQQSPMVAAMQSRGAQPGGPPPGGAQPGGPQPGAMPA